MANTFELIASTTVGSGGAANIDFTSIPSTFTDLCIKLTLRATTGGVQGVRIKINTSASNLSERQLEGVGSGTPASSSTTSGFVVVGNGSTDTANTFSNCEIYLPNYLSSSNKSWSADFVTENNATAAYAGFTAGLWSQTAAIYEIGILATNPFAQHSTAYLYGVKNA
jgi:hypothetical protein